MRHIGHFIMNMLSLLSSSLGDHKRGGQGAAGTDPFILRREIMTFRFGPEREEKGHPPSGMRARGRDDSTSRKQCKQNDEGTIHKRQECSAAIAYWRQLTTHSSGAGCGLTGLV